MVLHILYRRKSPSSPREKNSRVEALKLVKESFDILSMNFHQTRCSCRFHGTAEKVIDERVEGLDLAPHPVTQKQLNAVQKKKIKSKIEKRKATREEYKNYMWNKRFKARRDKAVKDYWTAEMIRVLNNAPTTRDWTPEQRAEIAKGHKATYNGTVLEGHHTYSASEYPHLANNHLVIYPATKNEHLNGWHGGNYKKSLPGRRIRRIQEF